MKVVVIDNYDSFTYNLVHQIEGILDEEVSVFKNDETEEESLGKYDKIILSPGPGIPSEAGSMPAIIKAHHREKSILGVCLGHQAIAEAFGGKLRNLDFVYHGLATKCRIISKSRIFMGIPEEFEAGRYHSWVVEEMPVELEVTAVDDNGLVMAFQHKHLDVTGVQFHPESVLTPLGEKMMRNWLMK